MCLFGKLMTQLLALHELESVTISTIVIIMTQSQNLTDYGHSHICRCHLLCTSVSVIAVLLSCSSSLLTACFRAFQQLHLPLAFNYIDDGLWLWALTVI